MQDVSQGAERVRAWPPSKGRRRSTKQRQLEDQFRLVQLATKFMAPMAYAAIEVATRGTPLLPRDVMTMQLYNRLGGFILPDGRRLYPVTARTDVEQALDTITQTSGEVLRKTEAGWEGWSPPTPAAGGAWQVIHDAAIAAGSANVEVALAHEYSILALIARAVTTSTSTNRVLQVGTGAPVSWASVSGDYVEVAASGTESNFGTGASQITASALARDLIAVIFGANLPIPARPILNLQGSVLRMFVKNSDPITGVRFFGQAGTLSGGRLTVIGQRA